MYGLGIQIGQGETGDEEDRRRYRCAAAQKIRGTAGTEQAPCRTGTERCTHIGALAMLNQNQTDQHHCCNYMYYPGYCFHTRPQLLKLLLRSATDRHELFGHQRGASN